MSAKALLLGNGNRWSVRRRMALYITTFCMIMVVWSARWVPSEALASSIIQNSFVLLGVIVASYVAGRVVDDHLSGANATSPVGAAIAATVESIVDASNKPDASIPTDPPKE